VINELFATNEDRNESSIETIEQSPVFVPLSDLDALLPVDNSTLLPALPFRQEIATKKTIDISRDSTVFRIVSINLV